jgi:hypothetical protein
VSMENTTNTIATVTVGDQELNIEKAEYHEGNIALFAYDPAAGELYDVITTSLPGHALSATTFFIKDHTAAGALGSTLIRNRIIEVAGPTVTYGNFGSTATEYRLATDR